MEEEKLGLLFTKQDEDLIITLKGRLDTTTYPILEEKVNNLDYIPKKIVLDFNELDYISSAGLRVVLTIKKKFKDSTIVLEKMNQFVYDVFDMTGFVDCFTITRKEETDAETNELK